MKIKSEILERGNNMKIKSEILERVKSGDVIHSDDVYYDLFVGEYISPFNILESDDAERVNSSIAVIMKFLETLEDSGVLEIQ